jgi:hypothetical protein
MRERLCEANEFFSRSAFRVASSIMRQGELPAHMDWCAARTHMLHRSKTVSGRDC